MSFISAYNNEAGIIAILILLLMSNILSGLISKHFFILINTYCLFKYTPGHILQTKLNLYGLHDSKPLCSRDLQKMPVRLI